MQVTNGYFDNVEVVESDSASASDTCWIVFFKKLLNCVSD